MGTPIGVGTQFGDYWKVSGDYANSFSERGAKCAMNVLGKGIIDKRQATIAGTNIIMQGHNINKKAYLYCDWMNNTESIYTNEYKPEVKRSVEYEGSSNVPFTTIYDWGQDDNGEEYYIKAEDKNGNGVVDDGEITHYNSLEELFPNGY